MIGHFTQAQKRMAQHSVGIHQAQSGQLSEARDTFREALMTYGEHVLLLSDLASVYYLLNEMTLWRRLQWRLQQILEDQTLALSSQSRGSAILSLAKFFEEDGKVANAAKLYRQCLSLALTGPSEFTTSFHLKILPQILRLEALFPMNADLNALYTELLSLREGDVSFDQHVEIQHSLMLAELNLVGPEHAWSRVQQHIDHPQVAEIDQRLFFYDFVEEILIRNLPWPKTLRRYANRFKNHSSMELAIHQLAFGGGEGVSVSELNRFATTMPWSSYIRLLCALQAKAQSSSHIPEYRNRLHLILGALDMDSRGLWSHRLKIYFGDPELSLELLSARRLVRFQNRELDLTKKKGMLRLLELLSQQQTLTVDQAIEALWSQSFSPECYHRLRMTSHRLNQLLFELTSVPKLIEVNAEHVRLRSTVQFVQSSSIKLAE